MINPSRLPQTRPAGVSAADRRPASRTPQRLDTELASEIGQTGVYCLVLGFIVFSIALSCTAWPGVSVTLFVFSILLGAGALFAAVMAFALLLSAPKAARIRGKVRVTRRTT